MSGKNEAPILILSFLLTAGLLGGGYWWFSRQPKTTPDSALSPTVTPSPPIARNPTNSFNAPETVATGTTLKIDGSTSMVSINEALKKAFMGQFSGTTVETNARGTDKGILDLLVGRINIAAVSRPLTPEEQAQGLVAIPVAQDAIAIVVGNNNAFRRGLTQQQVRDIFQGRITNWSQISGQSGTIRVINRPAISGTHQTFQQLVLNSGDFGTTPNIKMMERDATTPILQALKDDGISYATYAQIAQQRTVRTVAVDGLTPEAPNYPYQRNLYYVYKEPANPSVKAFLGFVTSSEGKEAIATASQ